MHDLSTKIFVHLKHKLIMWSMLPLGIVVVSLAVYAIINIAYRSKAVEIMADGYRGYLYLKAGSAYAVNLNPAGSKYDDASFIGEYKSVDRSIIIIDQHQNMPIRFEKSCLSLKVIHDDQLSYSHHDYFDGIRVFWPPTLSRIHCAVRNSSIIDSAVGEGKVTGNE